MTKAIKNLISKIRDSRDANGEATVSSVEVAKLIRHRLKAKFKKDWPKVKFSVRSDSNSVNINWDNGPSREEVKAVTGSFSFGGFDGSIDMAYSSKNWLHADGRMSACSSNGTQGSMGYAEAYVTDCPEPGAIIVKYGPKYIFENRNVTDEVMEQAVKMVMDEYGAEWQEGTSAYRQRMPDGQDACRVASRNGWVERVIASA